MPCVQNSLAMAVEWVTNSTVTSSSAMISCTRSLHFLENLRSPTDYASSTTRMSGRIDEENANPSHARLPLE